MSSIATRPLRDAASPVLPARVLDAAALALAVGIGALALEESWRTDVTTGPTVDIALAVAAFAALILRRRHPAAVATFALAASAVSALAIGPALVALFAAAVHASSRFLAPVVAVAAVAAAVAPAINPTEDAYLPDVVTNVLLTAVVVGWGLYTRARRDVLEAARERAERLQAEQRMRVDQARESERRRIAGEMHDVLAHRVSLLSLQAGALELRPDAPPEQIAQAAAAVRVGARAVMEELREVVGVIGDGRGSATAPPQPTLMRVPALVAESQAAGMPVELRFDVLEGVEPPGAIARTAHRVVQEGLTNARKHAPGARACVRVAGAPGSGLLVTVRSRPAVGSRTGLPGSGTGLIGLQERVAQVGGRLSHGAEPGGDFVVDATLPWPA